MPSFDDWWINYDNIIILIDYLADMEWSGKEIADVVEKPWHFTTEYQEALIHLSKQSKESGE